MTVVRHHQREATDWATSSNVHTAAVVLGLLQACAFINVMVGRLF